MLHLRASAVVGSRRGPLTFVCSMRALHRFETYTGRVLSDSLTPGAAPDMRLVRALLWALLADEHEELSIDDVGKRWEPRELPAVVLAAADLIRASLPAVKGAGADSKSGQSAAHSLTDWQMLWAVGRVDMQLPEDEFWSLTPALFDALLTRAKARYGVATGELEAPAQTNTQLARKFDMLAGIMGAKK